MSTSTVLDLEMRFAGLDRCFLRCVDEQSHCDAARARLFLIPLFSMECALLVHALSKHQGAGIKLIRHNDIDCWVLGDRLMRIPVSH